ncbi:hypothetical protein BGZ72_004147 [Mortierella alpina]|nr:hypothetical protein BGZ72_004147 [Mortierella alpina]
MTAALPTPTHADSEVLSKAVRSSDSTYKYLYFGLHGRGELTRTLLKYGGVKFEELTADWPAQKSQVPFRCLPVVYETTADGTVLELAESQAIERYLSKKFNLLGKNDYENHLVDRYVSSTDSASQMFRVKIIQGPAENRVEEANKFYAEVLPQFIAIHEEHLKKNGSNGHYVGNQFTLADINTASFIDRLLFLRPQGANEVPFSAENSPNLWKLRETVFSHPNLAAWKSSPRHQELDAATKGFFKF